MNIHVKIYYDILRLEKIFKYTSITFSFFFCSAFLLGADVFLGGISFTIRYLQISKAENLLINFTSEQKFTFGS